MGAPVLQASDVAPSAYARGLALRRSPRAS